MTKETKVVAIVLCSVAAVLFTAQLIASYVSNLDGLSSPSEARALTLLQSCKPFGQDVHDAHRAVVRVRSIRKIGETKPYGRIMRYDWRWSSDPSGKVMSGAALYEPVANDWQVVSFYDDLAGSEDVVCRSKGVDRAE